MYPCMDVNTITSCDIKFHYVVWVLCQYGYVIMLLCYDVVMLSCGWLCYYVIMLSCGYVIMLLWYHMVMLS